MKTYKLRFTDEDRRDLARALVQELVCGTEDRGYTVTGQGTGPLLAPADLPPGVPNPVTWPATAPCKPTALPRVLHLIQQTELKWKRMEIEERVGKLISDLMTIMPREVTVRQRGSQQAVVIERDGWPLIPEEIKKMENDSNVTEPA